jgi:hypothetical protein
VRWAGNDEPRRQEQRSATAGSLEAETSAEGLR